MRGVISTFLLIFSISHLFAGDVATRADARLLAKQSNKPILLYFWSDN